MEMVHYKKICHFMAVILNHCGGFQTATKGFYGAFQNATNKNATKRLMAFL